MGRLTHISMAGIDERTDLDGLKRLQAMDRRVEFGVLMSAKWQENGNRYPNPEWLENLKDMKLNLSVHLCGRIAREAVRNNWRPALNLLGDYATLFKRVQLNIAHYASESLNTLNLDVPKPFEEAIIQQKASYDCRLFYDWLLEHPEDSSVTVLIDGSGGLGMEKKLIPLCGAPKVGYAGGIGPENVYEKAKELFLNENVEDFWVDMESKVRTDDWFDLNKAEKVIQQVNLAQHIVTMNGFVD